MLASSALKRVGTGFIAIMLLGSSLSGSTPTVLVEANPNFPTAGTFANYNGTQYVAEWNYTTYELELTGSKFPWIAAPFPGANGSINLWQSGDIKSIKGRDYTSISHRAKIGIREAGKGQWISNPQSWVIAPAWIGYSANTMGLGIGVKATHLGQYHSATGIVEVTLTNPSSNSRSLSITYAQAMAVAWGWGESYVGTLFPYQKDKAWYDQSLDAIVAQDMGFGWKAYLYSDLPISDWSASDKKLESYITYETLDKTALNTTATNDAEVAIRVTVTLAPYESKTISFFTSLDWNSRKSELLNLYRTNFATLFEELKAQRLEEIKLLTIVRTSDARVNFAYFMANLVQLYLTRLNYPWLINYEQAHDYTPETLTFATTGAKYLNPAFLAPLKEYLVYKGTTGYLPRENGVLDMIPDRVLRFPSENPESKRDYSELTGTAMWISSILQTYEATGDLTFLQNVFPYVSKALKATEKFDSNGDGFPEIRQAMTDIRGLGGTYAYESALATYAYRDGSRIYAVLGDNSNAAYYANLYEKNLVNYDKKFWDDNVKYYVNYDLNGNVVKDRWIHVALVPDEGVFGRSKLLDILGVLEGPDFSDPFWGVRWLGVGDPHYAATKMQGGFWTWTPQFVAVLEFLADRGEQGTQYTGEWADQIIQGGWYDETFVHPPSLDASKFRGLNLYGAPARYGMQVMVRGMGMEVEGNKISVSPKWVFESFEIDNLVVSHMGHSVTLRLSKMSGGALTVEKISDDGGYFSIVIGAPLPVRKLSSITASLSPSTAIYGDAVQVAATISESVSDGLVTLEQSSDKVTWFPIAGGSGSPVSGVFSFTWIPQLAGKINVRAIWSGNSDFFGSSSNAQLLTINPTPNMALNIPSLLHSGNSATLTVQGQATYSNGVPYVGEVSFSHKDQAGVTLKASTLTSDLAGSFFITSLKPIYGVNSFQAYIANFGGPISKIHNATLSATLLDVQWSSLTLRNGETLTVTFRVQNIGDIILATQNPLPGYPYLASDTFLSKGFKSENGAFRVAVDYSARASLPAYPFRWGLGLDMSPGQTSTIACNIKITTTAKISTQVWGGLIFEPSATISDQINPVTINFNP